MALSGKLEERSGEATGKGSVSVATETLGLRGHGEKLMFGILKGQDKLLLEAQPRLQRNHRILELPGSWDDH